MVPEFAILTVVSATFVGVAIFIAFIFWFVLRQSASRYAAWSKVANQLGLEHGGRTTLSGQLHGQRVRASIVTRGSGDSRSTYTVVRADLYPPLDLGLDVREHGFFNDMFHAAADVPLGDAAFDATFITSADEPERLRALLDPGLRRLLLSQLANTAASFRVRDDGVVIERPGAISDPAWLAWALQLSARIVGKLDASRRRTPCSAWLRQHRQTWLRFAQTHGLTGLDTPLCMWGTMEGRPVQIYAVRTDRARYELELSVGFSAPLGLGLALQPKGLLDKLAVFFGSQDHELGDPWFDDTYLLRVERTDLIGEVLDASVRAEIMAVHQGVGPVTLDDHRLTVRLPNVPNHPGAVPQVLHRLVGLVERLGARGSQRIGPYR